MASAGVSTCCGRRRGNTSARSFQATSEQAFLQGTIVSKREGVIKGVICRPPTPFLSPIPPLILDARSISSRFPLRRKRGAVWLEIGPFSQASRGRQGRATKLGPRPVRRCSTADANITRPRGDARPAKVSTLWPFYVLGCGSQNRGKPTTSVQDANGVFTNIAGLNTFAPAHLVSSVHTTSKVLYAQRLGSSFQAQRRVDWPLYIVPYHSSRQCSNRTYHTGVSPWPVGT